ncbi:ubiquitin-like-specific protease ESD4 [Apium graveolens]|uniref:ubiquitin-like-specific protease ESD4 n=1 Tax=Apium graveolens TaxID=4045 RepID=UPI003D7B80A5
MGVFTRDRKRGSDYNSPTLHVNQSYSRLRFDSPVPKKLKSLEMSISAVLERPGLASKNAAYKVQQYPSRYSRIRREVHAPCGNKRFARLRVSGNVRREDSDSGDVSRRGDSDGFKREVLVEKFEKLRSEALDTFRYVGKGKEVTDVDDYIGKENATVWEDLSVEEVEIVENGKESWREDEGKMMDIDKTTGERNFQPSCSSVVSEDLPNANLKSESAGKVLDVVPMEQDIGMLREAVYKKLYNSAVKHDKKLDYINFQIALNTNSLSTLRLRPTAKKPTKEVVVKEPFVPLTEEEQNEVNRAFSNASRRKILVTHENSNIEITGELLRCLRPGAWLNDEVINLYLELLKEREKRHPKQFLKCHFFNTFFYKKLIGGGSGYDYKSVRRWTTQRKLGYSLIECEKIFVPIHKEAHWCLAVINRKDEKFQYLDSLKGGDRQVMKVLAKYIVDEMKDKTGKSMDVSSWKQEFVEDLPEQKNGYDCGVFMIKYADFYSRDVGLCFDQKHMQYFRQRTAKEILRLKAD